MNLDWMEDFSDPYLKTPGGKGIFLSGVLLGMIAKSQVDGKQNQIYSAPLFKQIMFGKMQRRDLERHMSRVPNILKVYDIKHKTYQDLAGKAGDLLFKGNEEMGVDGNFAFSVAFMNADNYFWKIFGAACIEKSDISDIEEDVEKGGD